MQEPSGHNDARYRAEKPVTLWEVIDKPIPFGNPLKRLRIIVKYANGTVRVLPASFSDRAEVDKYIERFHPNFAGKERLNAE